MTFDGETLFSKKESGRFPLPDEVEDALGERLG